MTRTNVVQVKRDWETSCARGAAWGPPFVFYLLPWWAESPPCLCRARCTSAAAGWTPVSVPPSSSRWRKLYPRARWKEGKTDEPHSKRFTMRHGCVKHKTTWQEVRTIIKADETGKNKKFCRTCVGGNRPMCSAITWSVCNDLMARAAVRGWESKERYEHWWRVRVGTLY